jgi:hypothetical protein|tara:strand:+ start:355 stop:1062 length:708 start_codon:yes stop_codon:yes gene_type:complete
MFEKNISDYKPNSIFDYIPRDWFLKTTLEENYIDSGNCYEQYYAIGRYYEPRTILEIGVLYGYSAAAMILGAKNRIQKFQGWDISYYATNKYKDDNNENQYFEGEFEYPGWSSNRIATIKLKEIVDNNFPMVGVNDNNRDGRPSISIDTTDSQEVERLNRFYDLIHIDGSHIGEHKLHDLNLTLGKCYVVVVDDYDFIDDVKTITNHFVETYSHLIRQTHYIDSHRGTLLIEYKY